MNKEISYSPLNKVLIGSFILFSAGYLATLELRPYPLSYIVKIIPIISLMVFAYYNISSPRRKFVLAALIMSAAGDVFLAMSGNGLFLYGLGSFAAAHCLYIAAFFDKPELKKRKSFFILFFLLYGISIASILTPRLGNMMIPVLSYITLITIMGISAAAGKNNHILLVAGAFLFMISDSLIAVNMFLKHLPNSSFWIMVTYFPAQFLITWGVSINNNLKKAISV